jgi:hypothetical protein
MVSGCLYSWNPTRGMLLSYFFILHPQVLRSYDSRVRKTNRSAEVYLSQECKKIIGETVVLLKLPEEDAAAESNKDAVVAAESKKCHINDKFWIKSKEHTLLIIAAPYRPGGHVAKRPEAFLPIISQLETLHET